MVWNFVVYLAIALVAGYVAAALAPKPEPPKPAGMDDFDVPTADDGKPIAVVFGEVWMRDPNVIWYGDLRSTPIKKKGGKK